MFSSMMICYFEWQDGDRFWRMPECYIRGSTIKYLRIPDEVIDMVKEEVIQKSKGRGEMRGRGGPQRGGRGGRGIYSHADSTKTVNSMLYITCICRFRGSFCLKKQTPIFNITWCILSSLALLFATQKLWWKCKIFIAHYGLYVRYSHGLSLLLIRQII